MTPRILILSWEYPPIVAGGLARHVHKLSEALVAHGVEAVSYTHLTLPTIYSV